MIDAYNQKNWRSAVNLAERLSKQSPDSVAILRVLGASQTQLGRYAEAEPVFEHLLRLVPQDPESLAGLCLVKKELERDDALETCLAAVKHNTSILALHQITAKLLTKAGRNAEAREQYLQAHRISPENLAILTALTSLDAELGDEQKALERTREAIARHPNVEILYLNAISWSLNTRQYELAIQLADEGFSKFHHKTILPGKARALYGLQKFEEARLVWNDIRPEILKNEMLKDTFLCESLKTDIALDRIPLAEDLVNLKKTKACQGPNQIYVSLGHLLCGQYDAARDILNRVWMQSDKTQSAMASLVATAIALKKMPRPENILTQDILRSDDVKTLRQEAKFHWLNALQAFSQEELMVMTARDHWPESIRQELQVFGSFVAQTKQGSSCAGMPLHRSSHPTLALFVVMLGLLVSLFARRWRAGKRQP